MAKKKQPIDAATDPISRWVRDEAIAIPPGDTVYTIDLDEATVDGLADGICSEGLARRMFALLSWRREAVRQVAREAARVRHDVE